MNNNFFRIKIFFIIGILGLLTILNSLRKKTMLNIFSSYNKYKTDNASNKSLVTMNGSINLSRLSLGNILINGQATMGESSIETKFNDIVVINGNLNAQNSSFETLEVNGNADIQKCAITLNGQFFGNAKFNDCKLTNLELRGRNFLLKNSIVEGNIKAIAIGGRGKLILHNTIVKETAKFDKDDGDIIYIND